MHWLLIIRDILRVRFQWSAALPTSVSIISANIHGDALLISCVRLAAKCLAWTKSRALQHQRPAAPRDPQVRAKRITVKKCQKCMVILFKLTALILTVRLTVTVTENMCGGPKKLKPIWKRLVRQLFFRIYLRQNEILCTRMKYPNISF